MTTPETVAAVKGAIDEARLVETAMKLVAQPRSQRQQFLGGSIGAGGSGEHQDHRCAVELSHRCA